MDGNQEESDPDIIATSSCGGVASKDAGRDGGDPTGDRDASDASEGGREGGEAGLGVAGPLGGAVDPEVPVKAELSCNTILGPLSNGVSNADVPAK